MRTSRDQTPRLGAPAPTMLRVVLTSFAVVFACEWGDITQITTANFVARYHDPLIIGAAALLALWAASALPRPARRHRPPGGRGDPAG